MTDKPLNSFMQRVLADAGQHSWIVVGASAWESRGALEFVATGRAVFIEPNPQLAYEFEARHPVATLIKGQLSDSRQPQRLLRYPQIGKCSPSPVRSELFPNAGEPESINVPALSVDELFERFEFLNKGSIGVLLDYLGDDTALLQQIAAIAGARLSVVASVDATRVFSYEIDTTSRRQALIAMGATQLGRHDEGPAGLRMDLYFISPDIAAEIGSIKGKLASARATEGDTNRLIASLKNELQSAKAELAERDEALIAADDAKNKYLKDNEKIHSELRVLREIFEEKSHLLEAAKRAQRECSDEMRHLHVELSAARENLAQQEVSLQNLQASLEGVRTELAAKAKALGVAESVREQERKAHQKTRSELQSVHKELEHTNENLKAAQLAEQDALILNDELKAVIGAARKEIWQKEEALQAIDAKLEASERARATLRSDLQAARLETQGKEEALLTAQARIESAAAKLAEEQGRAKTLSGQIEALKESIYEEKRKTTDMSERKDEERQRADYYARALEVSRADLRDLQKKFAEGYDYILQLEGERAGVGPTFEAIEAAPRISGANVEGQPDYQTPSVPKNRVRQKKK